MSFYSWFLTIFSQQVVIFLIALVVAGDILRLWYNDSVNIPRAAKVGDAIGWGLLGIFYAGQIAFPTAPIDIQRFMVRVPIVLLTINEIALHFYILHASVLRNHNADAN